MITPDWPFHLAATLLGLLSAFILYRSLLHNRSRGRRRCPKCWYDMSGADASREKGLVCPECGRDAKRERRLYKTRKRWGWAAIGIAMAIAAYAAVMTPRVRRDGILKYVPTEALIMSLSSLETDRASKSLSWRARAHAEIGNRARMSGASWTESRRRRFAEKALEVPNWPKVPMCLSCESVIRGWRSDPVIDRLHAQLVGREMLATRRRWPEGTPFVYGLAPNLFLIYSDVRREIVIQPRSDSEALRRILLAQDERPAGLERTLRRWDDGKREMELPLPRKGDQIVGFEISITENGHLIWGGGVSSIVHFEGSAEEILTPVSASAADQIAEGIGATIFRRPDSSQAVLLVDLSPVSQQLGDALSGATFAVLCEALKKGEPFPLFLDGAQRTASVFAWQYLPPGGWFDDRYAQGPGSQWVFPVDVSAASSDDADCSIRLTGDANVALRDFATTSYWSGEVTIPVRLRMISDEEFDDRFMAVRLDGIASRTTGNSKSAAD